MRKKDSLREAAAEAGQPIYHSTVCHKGHASGRFTRSGACVECQRDYQREHRRRITATLKEARAGNGQA